MSNPADSEKPVDTLAAPTAETAPGEASSEAAKHVDPSNPVRENGIDEPVPSKDGTSSTPQVPKEEPVAEGQNKETVTSVQEVKPPANKVKVAGEGSTEHQNGDASGNVRIPDDSELSKPVREETTDKDDKKPIRRNSTMSIVREKLRPRGRVTRKSAAPRGSKGGHNGGGGCVIF